MSIEAFIAGSCIITGAGVGLLHGQKRADALDLTLEAAVCQALAFGGQPASGHPLSILLLLQKQTARKGGETGVLVGTSEWARQR